MTGPSAYAPAVAEYFRRTTVFQPGPLIGQAGSRGQGAWIQVTAGLQDGILTRVGFRVYGCPHIIAACHRAAELLEQAPAQTLEDFDTVALARELEIPVEKSGKLLILKDALRNAYRAAAQTD